MTAIVLRVCGCPMDLRQFFAVGCPAKSFTVLEKKRLIVIKSRKQRTVNDFMCGLRLWGMFERFRCGFGFMLLKNRREIRS